MFVNSVRLQKILRLLMSVALVLTGIYPLFQPQKAHAAPLTEASIRLDRMGISEQYNTTTNYKVLVVAKVASTATEDAVQLVIQDDSNSGFTLDSTASNYGVSTTGMPSTYQGETLTAWTGINTATAVTDNGNTTTVTFPSGNLTPTTTLYGFYIICAATTCITNPSSSGTKTIQIKTRESGSDVDTQTVAVDIVNADTDQVTLTATVDPSFNFALSGNSIALGTLSTSARTTGNVTVDVDTNANNGWMAYIRSEGAAATLASASTSDSISSANTGSCVTATIGAKGYVVDVNASAGSGAGGVLSVDTEYDCTDNQAGGVISTAYEQVAQRTGVVDSDTLTLTAVVTISATTKAATDYTDIWEVVGAGNF